MKLKNLLQTTAIFSLLIAGNAAFGQTSNGNLFIIANDDGENSNENIIFQIGGINGPDVSRQTQMTITTDGTTINDSLSVLGSTATTTLTVSGSTALNSTLNVGGNADFQAGVDILAGGLNVTGVTDLNSGLNVDGLTTLDSTTIDGTTSITGTTSINTTGTNATTIGNSNADTDVIMVGGSSRVVLDNGTTSINTSVGAANTSIGVAGNTTSILSTSIILGNHTTASAVSVGTGTSANTITMGNGVIGTVINASAANTTMVMQDDSITNTVSGRSGGVSGSTVIANNGSDRWVADANGKLTKVTSDDETSGTTAAMVVTNSAGNTHGLVVQEAKTTISGGTNSSSMTLSDNGATFSDSATGQPIQVHGVADGTADFDAVNVRQLYSGLAAVLAASPEINLAPGKTGMGIGVGGYGGFEAIGVGFGHMYDNGAIVRASVSKAAHSEVAYSAGVSWNW
ncbi:MAG: YadA-like family protein [Loktanella sp.]|nr:YadA-like family protein [Loktanella sp.]